MTFLNGVDNEDMKQTVTQHLIEEIPNFPLAGQEDDV